MVELYTNINKLFMKEDEKRELIIREFLHKKKLEPSQIFEVLESDKLIMPEFTTLPEEPIYRIKIDTINPLHPQEFVKLELSIFLIQFFSKMTYWILTPIILPLNK